jgi:hypothetical protein
VILLDLLDIIGFWSVRPMIGRLPPVAMITNELLVCGLSVTATILFQLFYTRRGDVGENWPKNSLVEAATVLTVVVS